jgi:hypothetical protein
VADMIPLRSPAGPSLDQVREYIRALRAEKTLRGYDLVKLTGRMKMAYHQVKGEKQGYEHLAF